MPKEKEHQLGRQTTLAERLLFHCDEEFYRSLLFNDAVSRDDKVINEYGAVGGMKIGTETGMLG
jgi:hypothetical protein